jgi:hypothetical protein
MSPPLLGAGMQRREFISFLGGATAAWPLAVRAQQPERVRQIGMLNALGSDDPEAQAPIAVFKQSLQQLGWVVGQNLKIEIRQIGADVDRLRSNVAELVALAPEVILNVTRALVLRDPTSAAGIGQFAAARSVAHSLGVELTPVNVRDTDEIERNVAAFARSGNGGMIVTSGGTGSRRKLIIDLASRHKLPSVYPYRYYAVDGGLVTYGPNTLDPIRRAAGYVDRILKGEKPADMPVQAPTKYELIINLKTAKTLGLTIPQSLLTTADEVIE